MKKIIPDPPRLAPFISVRSTLTRDEAMAAAVEVLDKQKGGMVAILDGQVLAAIPLPIAGLMSDKPAAEVDAAMDDLYDKARRILGVSADVDVIMTLCFMSLPVIPKLKLLDTGLFDVEAFDFVPVELS